MDKMTEWLLGKFCRTITIDFTEVQQPSGAERQLPLMRIGKGDTWILNDKCGQVMTMEVTRFDRFGATLKIKCKTNMEGDCV